MLFYAADVVILPYKVTAGSGVMFDALAHGLPFIATNLGFFKEFVCPRIRHDCQKRSSVNFQMALKILIGITLITQNR